MKSHDRIRKRVMGCLLAAVLLSTVPFASAADPSGLIERTAATLIMESTGSRFPDEQGCGEGTTTVGSFIADSLLLASANTGLGMSVAFTCEAHGNTAELISFYSSSLFAQAAAQQLQQLPSDATLHQCTLTLGANSGEAQWARAVQVLIDETTPRIIEGTARCILTP